MTDVVDFQFSRADFETMVEEALQQAYAVGATDAVVEVSEAYGLSVSVRMQALENVEHNRDKSMGITVYCGHQRGHASTSDFSKQAIIQTVKSAYDIARFTAQDEHSGLPDLEDIAQGPHQDLQLFFPWNIEVKQALELAQLTEKAALDTDARISNSEGASVYTQHAHFFMGHMRQRQFSGQGVFRGGYAHSRHGFSVAPIAIEKECMQRDAWFSSMIDPRDLSSPIAVGRYAAERALARLHAKKIATTTCPVLFEAPLAAGLLGSLVHALSGGALYRKSSFLLDSLGHCVLPPDIDVIEDPFILKGKGSCPFDQEGVKVRSRFVIRGGRVQGYFLNTYAARKLGMKTTGNAGGSHHLSMTHRQTQGHDDLPAMLKKLDTGLFVTELMGQGVNGVTGDYSRGASGYWVEKGQIIHPVEEITIAGNLKQMFQDIQAIGADVYTMGAKSVGSVLVGSMRVAGH